LQHLANNWLVVIRLKGFIFFGSAQKLKTWVHDQIDSQRELGIPTYQRLRWVLFDCSLLDGLDSSAMKALSQLNAWAVETNIQILWCRVPSGLLGQLKSGGAVQDESHCFVSHEQAVHYVEGKILAYAAEQQRKWATLNPFFNLAHQMSQRRSAFEPFEDVLTMDATRFGCPWKYGSRLKTQAFSTVLWEPGNVDVELFLVHAGKVGLFSSMPSGNEDDKEDLLVAVCGHGQFLNPEAVLSLPTKFHAVALEDGELFCWDQQQWAQMLREAPQMASALLRAVLAQEQQPGGATSKPPRETPRRTTLTSPKPNLRKRPSLGCKGSGSSLKGVFTRSGNVGGFGKSRKGMRRSQSLSGFDMPANCETAAEDFNEETQIAEQVHLDPPQELQPWMRGLSVALSLDKLGLFQPAGAATTRPTVSLPACVDEDLLTAFRTYAEYPHDPDDPDGHPSISGGCLPSQRVSEALLYAGISGAPLSTSSCLHLTEEDFVALGRELSVVRFSPKQEAKLRELFRQYDVTGQGRVDRTELARLFRESVDRNISAEEVDGLVSMWGGTAQRSVDMETYLAIMARIVRRHERDWYILRGVWHLMDSEKIYPDSRLTPDMLMERAVDMELTLPEAEEMLWCMDSCGGKGQSLDIRMLTAALLPIDASAANLPPPPIDVCTLRPESSMASSMPEQAASEDSVPEQPQRVSLFGGCFASTNSLPAAVEPECISTDVITDMRYPDSSCQGGERLPERQSQKLLVDFRSLVSKEEAWPHCFGCPLESELPDQRGASKLTVPSLQQAKEEEEEAPSTCRARLHLLLEEPSSSRMANYISVVMGIMILVSVLTLFLEPLVSPPDQPISKVEKEVWYAFEFFFTVVFSLEFVLRLTVANALGKQTTLDFLKRPMNISDVVAILPFYVDQSLDLDQEEFRLFRIARLMRLARLVRLGRLAKKSATFAPIAVILTVIWGIYMQNGLENDL